jgi:hypothetical protein
LIVLAGLALAAYGVLVIVAMVSTVGSSVTELDMPASVARPAELSVDATKAMESTLAAGRLAPLPGTATDIRVARWTGMGTGASYLAFRATPEEIEAFLTGSRSILHSGPETFGPEHMNLPVGEPAPGEEGRAKAARDARDPGGGAILPQDRHRRYRTDPVVGWYRPTVTTRGRRFEIPRDEANRGHNSGEVVVDDEHSVVWVLVIYD